MNSSERFSDIQDHRRGQGTQFGMDAVCCAALYLPLALNVIHGVAKG